MEHPALLASTKVSTFGLHRTTNDTTLKGGKIPLASATSYSQSQDDQDSGSSSEIASEHT